MAQWKALPDKQHLSIAVNISAVQFQDPKFAQQVISLLDQTQAPADHLELEITESMLISDLDKIIDILLLLKTKGIRFSLDDFGTGYSSLDRLTNLPLDQLKIDQRFVRNLDKHTRDAAVAKTIIDLGRNLGLSVIAEGVETEYQRERLLELGCYQFQGYLFSKPALLSE
ncbi:EAL domain-containing protein [Nitrincola nitratireducens]|uniref:EAL domain-containing protein n=1 Tax=Nitrincola nitratireducens TaxID=1229521 RepID=UPI001ED9BFE0|nr:EAL domain-containing protein [Nitrincola nitratireducens]